MANTQLWTSSAWLWANLAPNYVYSEAFTTWGMPFFPPASIILCPFSWARAEIKNDLPLATVVEEFPRKWLRNEKFGPSFSSFWAFRAYFRLDWPNHSSLGTIRKGLILLLTLSISDAMQFWPKMMVSEVEQSPTVVMAGYGRIRRQWIKKYKEGRNDMIHRVFFFFQGINLISKIIITFFSRLDQWAWIR